MHRTVVWAVFISVHYYAKPVLCSPPSLLLPWCQVLLEAGRVIHMMRVIEIRDMGFYIQDLWFRTKDPRIQKKFRINNSYCPVTCISVGLTSSSNASFLASILVTTFTQLLTSLDRLSSSLVIWWYGDVVIQCGDMVVPCGDWWCGDSVWWYGDLVIWWCGSTIVSTYFLCCFYSQLLVINMGCHKVTGKTIIE